MQQELRSLLLPEHQVATLLTMIVVDPQDPAFANPTKFQHLREVLPRAVRMVAVTHPLHGRRLEAVSFVRVRKPDRYRSAGGYKASPAGLSTLRPNRNAYLDSQSGGDLKPIWTADGRRMAAKSAGPGRVSPANGEHLVALSECKRAGIGSRGDVAEPHRVSSQFGVGDTTAIRYATAARQILETASNGRPQVHR